ncbi:MAG TPA: DUF5663 domain-containing protein [Candidatus Paceibacterota bacterium]|nr:DUF5663 domain-containing protein [Candidatus Paceibacterota bacterium]
MFNLKDTLIGMFELDKLAPEKASEMVERLGKLIFQSVLVRALPLLSEEDMQEYERIIEGDQGGEALFKFLAEKVPDFHTIVAEEAEELKKELAGELKTTEL